MAAGGAGAGVVLGGCDLDAGSGPADPAGPTETTGAAPVRSPDADLRLLADARGLVLDASILVAACRDAFPSSRSRLASVAELHREHLRALDEAGPAADSATPSPPRPAISPGVAARRVRRQEERLQRRLAQLAAGAASGGFARLLASMSAGVAQHLDRLPAGPEAR